MKNKSLRTVIENARRLRRQIAPTYRLDRQGKHATAQSTAESIFHCPTCGSPVPASHAGRRGHAQRMPECWAAMQLSQHPQFLQKFLQKPSKENAMCGGNSHEGSKIFRVEAQGDVLYIGADTEADARFYLEKKIGEMPQHLLKFGETDQLPEGEELL